MLRCHLTENCTTIRVSASWAQWSIPTKAGAQLDCYHNLRWVLLTEMCGAFQMNQNFDQKCCAEISRNFLWVIQEQKWWISSQHLCITVKILLKYLTNGRVFLQQNKCTLLGNVTITFLVNMEQKCVRGGGGPETSISHGKKAESDWNWQSHKKRSYNKWKQAKLSVTSSEKTFLELESGRGSSVSGWTVYWRTLAGFADLYLYTVELLQQMDLNAS